MSRSEKLFKRDMVNQAKKVGGAFKTVSNRMKIAERVALRLAGLNIQIRSAAQLKVRHIEQYIESRKNEGISRRTLR